MLASDRPLLCTGISSCSDTRDVVGGLESPVPPATARITGVDVCSFVVTRREGLGICRCSSVTASVRDVPRKMGRGGGGSGARLPSRIAIRFSSVCICSTAVRQRLSRQPLSGVPAIARLPAPGAMSTCVSQHHPAIYIRFRLRPALGSRQTSPRA